MSGTSLDGIDLAVLETDGGVHIKLHRDGFVPYSDATRDLLRRVLDDTAAWPTEKMRKRADWPDVLLEAEHAVTQAHSEAVQAFLGDIEVMLVGFHGQTISHRPDEGFTLQIGDGQALANELYTDVVGQFRLADMAAGGQGAPLAPFSDEVVWDAKYWAASASKEELRAYLVAIINHLDADDRKIAARNLQRSK